MNYTTNIVIDICDLEDEICKTYNVEPFEGRNLLFGDDYANDCYKSFYIDYDKEYHGYSWENEADIKLRNLICAHLRKLFPNTEKVLIEVTW